MRLLAAAIAWTATLVLLSPAAWCDDRPPPNIYVGVSSYWDLEDDDQAIGPTIKFAGRKKITPDWGIYDGKLLVGVQYLALGTRAELKPIYGGPGVLWYDNHWGASLTLGTHLTREWIVEGTLRFTPDWDGGASVSVARGFNWSLLGGW